MQIMYTFDPSKAVELSTFLWDVKSNFGYLCLLSMLKGCGECCVS
jgi:hypothetical protein